VRRLKLPCGPLSIYRRYRRRSLLAFSSRCDLSRPKAEITEADAHFLGGLLRARSGVVSQGRGFWQVGRRKPSRKHLKDEAELPFERDDCKPVLGSRDRAHGPSAAFAGYPLAWQPLPTLLSNLHYCNDGSLPNTQNAHPHSERFGSIGKGLYKTLVIGSNS
jgi:hypothetical protein